MLLSDARYIGRLAGLATGGSVKHHFSRLSDLLFERLETFRGLQPLGLLKEKPSVQDLDGAGKLAREAVGFPSVPASWFGADPCAVANGYVALDAAVQEFRRIRATVDQFTDRTLSADWGDRGTVSRSWNGVDRGTVSGSEKSASGLPVTEPDTLQMP
jgi:hypothetical protein